MKSMSRRPALMLSGVGTAFVLAGGTGVGLVHECRIPLSPDPRGPSPSRECGEAQMVFSTWGRQPNSAPASPANSRGGRSIAGGSLDACTSCHFDLRFDGTSLRLFGNDSGRCHTRGEMDSLALMTGKQAYVLVTITPGSPVLQTHPVDRASPAGMMGIICGS